MAVKPVPFLYKKKTRPISISSSLGFLFFLTGFFASRSKQSRKRSRVEQPIERPQNAVAQDFHN
ncbi:hypothetical protein CRYUN_Cryun03dG0051400 [Craigia yunnanensis]